MLNSNYSNIISKKTPNPIQVNFVSSGADWRGYIISEAIVQNGGKDVFITLKRQEDNVVVANVDAHADIIVDKVEMWEGTTLLATLFRV